MTPPPVSPFRTRTMVLVIAAGLVFALGYLLVSAYGDRLDRQRSNAPGPATRTATGFYGLTRLVTLAGGSVTDSGDPAARPDRGILILTPNARTTREEMEAALADAAGPAAPVLIILPKWFTTPEPRRPWREQQVALLPEDRVAALLAPLVAVRVAHEAAAPLVSRTRLPVPAFRPPESTQSLRGNRLYPLITTATGGTVLGELPGKNIYILSDPDLLNNHGLAHRANARAALALLTGLDPAAPGTILFDTMLPYGSGGRTVLQLAFEPPFVGVTIALALAALLAGVASLIRFGPVRREQRTVPFGKAALIENIVSLARRAGRVKDGGNAYADAMRDWAARRLALPRTLQVEALDAHLDSLGTPASYIVATDRLRGAASETDLLHAAQALDDWRKEMKA